MTDKVTCPNCAEVSHIGGLIGKNTNDCPRCGKPVLAKPLEWQKLWDAMEASPESWILTTENMYWQMLECVPPRAMSRGGFLVGEPLRDNDARETIYSCFRRVGDEYHARNLTVKQFQYWGKT